MFPPRWKKVARDLVQNRSRTVFVVMSVAVGVFAVTVILGARGILLREFDKSLANSNAAAITFYTNGYDSHQAASVRRVRGVGEVETRTRVPIRYVLGDQTKQRTVTADDGRGSPASTTPAATDLKWKHMSLDVLDDFTSQNVNRITLVESRSWPPKRGEIAIEQSAQKVEPIGLGDYITIEKPAGGGTQRLRVSAIVHDINALPAQFGDTPITGFVSPENAADLKIPELYTIMLISSDVSHPTRSDYEKVANDAKDALEENNVSVQSTIINNPGSHFMGDIFKAVALLLLVMGVLSLFLSGFLVVNTINALMSGHVKQIGIMKAIGGRQVQVTGMYTIMMVVLSASALLIGVPVAAWVGQGLINYAIGAMNFRVESMIPPIVTMIISVLVGFFVPLISSLGPIVRGAKTPIVKAFNPAAAEVEKGFGHGLTDRILGKIRGLPRPVALSLRNTFLRKGRLITTLATLLLACAMIMAVITIRVGVGDTVTNFGVMWTYDLSVQFQGSEPAQKVTQEIAALDHVSRTETWSKNTLAYIRPDKTRDESVSIAAVPPDTAYYHPDLSEGRWIEDDPITDEICLSTVFVRDNPEATLGSDVTFEAYGKERTFKVVGILPSLAVDTSVYISETAWADWTGRSNDASVMYITTKGLSEEEIEHLGDTIEEKLDKDGYEVQNTAVRFRVQESFAKEMDILVTFLFIMAGVLGAVGVIGLSGTMMINVIDSTREIGVMRAIGASHKSIYSIFITEGVVVAVMSWVIGAVLSWPLSYLLNEALSSAIGFPLKYHFSYLGVAITLGLVLFISVLASLLPSWRASQISVRDAISYE